MRRRKFKKINKKNSIFTANFILESLDGPDAFCNRWGQTPIICPGIVKALDNFASQLVLPETCQRDWVAEVCVYEVNGGHLIGSVFRLVPDDWQCFTAVCEGIQYVESSWFRGDWMQETEMTRAQELYDRTLGLAEKCMRNDNG